MRKTPIPRSADYYVVNSSSVDRRQSAELTLQYLMTEEVDEYTNDLAVLELAARQLNHQHTTMARLCRRSLPPRRHSRNRKS
jgi:hypothetical protein